MCFLATEKRRAKNKNKLTCTHRISYANKHGLNYKYIAEHETSSELFSVHYRDTFLQHGSQLVNPSNYLDTPGMAFKISLSYAAWPGHTSPTASLGNIQACSSPFCPISLQLQARTKAFKGDGERQSPSHRHLSSSK